MKKTLNSERVEGPKCSSATPGSENGPKDQAVAPQPLGRAKGSAGAVEPAETAVELDGAPSPAGGTDNPPPALEHMEGDGDSAEAPKATERDNDPAATPEHITAAVNVLEDASEPMEIPKEPAATAPELPGVSFRNSDRWAEQSGPTLWMEFGGSSAPTGSLLCPGSSKFPEWVCPGWPQRLLV